MRLRFFRSAAACTALALPALVLFAPPSSADSSNVVASGLNNPRHLSFSATGDLYVAESGTGGPDQPGNCIVGAEGPACFGLTGSVTKVRSGKQTRVLTGLPSLAGTGGNSATGPADVWVTGNQRYAVSIGLGGTPATRAALPSGAAALGTLRTGLFHRDGSTMADLTGYEAAANPDGTEVDSNPVGIARWRGGFLAVDAGGNSLLRVRANGSVSTVATFPDRTVTAPWGAPFSMEAVPTSAVVGPDGAIYVSQLTGFPFPAGGAMIWRVVPGSAPTVWASGLTNVTDLAFSGNQLYAVEISTAGLANEQGLPMGALVRVDQGSTAPVVVADNLPAPYGIATRSGSAYVTVCSVCAGGGSVLAFPL